MEIETRWRVLRFLFAGGFGFALQLLILFALVEIFALQSGFAQNVANIVAVVVSAQVVFFLSYQFVWADRKRERRTKDIVVILVSYNTMRAFTLLIQIATFMLFSLFAPYIVSAIIGNGLAAVANYLGGDTFIFSKKKDP